MRPRFLAWAIVWFVNQFAPLYMALEITETLGQGRVGIILGSVLLFAAGWWICLKSETYGRALLSGGTVMAFMQFTMIPVAIAGLIGLFAADRFGLVRRDRPFQSTSIETVMGGFVATIVTGSLLMIASIAFGILWHAIFRQKSGGDPKKIETIDPDF